MIIEKKVTLKLESEEIERLKTVASIAETHFNDCLRKESRWMGYSFSELQVMAEFTRKLGEL